MTIKFVLECGKVVRSGYHKNVSTKVQTVGTIL